MQCLLSPAHSLALHNKSLLCCAMWPKVLTGVLQTSTKGAHTKAMHTLKGESVSPAICAGWHVPRLAVLLNQNEGSTMS